MSDPRWTLDAPEFLDRVRALFGEAAASGDEVRSTFARPRWLAA